MLLLLTCSMIDCTQLLLLSCLILTWPRPGRLRLSGAKYYYIYVVFLLLLDGWHGAKEQLAKEQLTGTNCTSVVAKEHLNSIPADHTYLYMATTPCTWPATASWLVSCIAYSNRSGHYLVKLPIMQDSMHTIPRVLLAREPEQS